MTTTDLIDNLRSPPVLCFALGVGARLLRSDLRIPDLLTQGLSVYLLFAIGLKGGAALAHGESGIAAGVLATLALATVIPLWSYGVARRIGRLARPEAASLAAHYGSTSAVTFLAALAYLESQGDPAEGFLTALLAITEVPAIVLALLLAGRGAKSGSMADAVRHVLTGKTVALLLGGMAIGWLGGEAGKQAVAPFFIAPFTGVLCLFLLDLGRVTAERLGELGRTWVFLVPFGLAAPLLHGGLGVVAGHLAGLSTGGATALGVLAGSASYIAAPAAMRVALPDANNGMPLAASLGVTFPFNLLFGIPLLHEFSRLVAGQPLMT